MNRLIKSGYILILLIIFSHQTFAQNSKTPPAPGLSFVGQLNVKIGNAYVVGETPHGLRRIIPILGGTVEGPDLKGEILPGGSDWQVVRKDGVAELEAHYQFKTDDGVIIYIKNVGLRVATPEVAARIGRGEQVSPNEYYFRAIPRFEAPAGKYAWMNNAIFICTAFRNPENVVIQVWKVL
ncbi:DUF3237 domain-containing protein [Spirosoma aerophilum]